MKEDLVMANELLTREECEKILKKQSIKDFELKNVQIVAATDVLGFLGEYYRLILHCHELQPNCNTEEKWGKKFVFFVKSLPQKSAEIQKYEIFHKESELYATLLNDLQSYSTIKWCPKSYYTRSDLLVLEDLNNAGYEKCRHDFNGLTDDEMKALLHALAALHASSILHEQLNGINIDEYYSAEILKEITVSQDIPYFTTGLKTILDLAKLHPLCQSKEIKNFVTNELEERLCDVYEMINPSSKYRNVLCHRDSWYGNVLFNYKSSNISAVLVDFQTCRYCPPCIDLIFAIFLNQEIELRKALEKYYLMWYYEKLNFELRQHDLDANVCLPFEELLSSYEDLKLFGFIYRIMVATFITVPVDLVTNDYKYIERTGPFVEFMATNESLRLYMEKCIAELLLYVIGKEK